MSSQSYGAKRWGLLREDRVPSPLLYDHLGLHQDDLHHQTLNGAS